jgi:membrane fusion protein, adhesin transport system
MMAELNEKGFQRIGQFAGRVSKFGDRFFGDWVEKMTPPTHRETEDWAGDADWAQLQQEPLRARKLLRIAAWVIVLLVIWAAFAQVDEVTRGEGKVVPTSQVQVLQSVDGGVVDDIMVHEGQMVEPGQVLLRIDPTRFASNLGESRASQVALRAKALRLQALTQGTAFNPPADLVKAAPDVVAQERSLFESRRAEISAQISISQNQLAQRQQELNEVRARKEQAERGLELTTRELTATKPLVTSGAVSEVEVLRLEQQVARLRGDRDQATAQISRVQAAIAEAQRKIEEVTLNSRNQMSAELSDTMSKLSALSEGGKALEDKVAKAEIRSQVKGTVKRLLVNTVGGVVQPGKEVIEIVPSEDVLILEAQVTPRDIAFLRPGLNAMVKFTAYDFAIYGGLEAVVENISADSVVDQKGNAFYIVRLRTKKPSLGANLPIIPGMVAQVDILTGKKTVLSYLLKPVLRAKANSLSER